MVRPCAARSCAAASSRSSHALTVGHVAATSTTLPSERTVTGEGPAVAPGIQARPISVARVQSEGSADTEELGMEIAKRTHRGRSPRDRGMIPCPSGHGRVYAMRMHATIDLSAQASVAIALAQVPVGIPHRMHTPQPVRIVDDDDEDDEDEGGGGSGGGIIDPDEDEGWSDDDDDDEDQTLWTLKRELS